MVGFLQEELRDLVGKIVMDSSATRVSPAKGGRAWELPGKGFSTLEGSGKEHLVEAAQDRLLENVVAGINQDTAQGKRIREQWTCAQASNLQVKEALRARNFPTQLPGLNASGHGRKPPGMHVKHFGRKNGVGYLTMTRFLPSSSSIAP